MVHLASAITVGLAGLAGLVSAHPGHDVKAEAAERAAFLKNAPVHSRSLSQCASKLKARGHENRNVARRQHIVKNLRAARGLSSSMPFSQPRTREHANQNLDNRYLKARSLNSTLSTSHHSSLTGVDDSTDPNVLFGSEATCILGPEVTQGPYCKLAGLLIESEPSLTPFRRYRRTRSQEHC